MSTSTPSRREVRSLIFHLLYAAESNEYAVPLESIIENFRQGFDPEFAVEIDDEVIESAQAILEKKEELNELLMPFLSNWRIDRIGCCTRLILYIALWEMYYTATPHKVIINEAIELAKCFAEKDAYKFINGILDEVTKKNAESTGKAVE